MSQQSLRLGLLMASFGLVPATAPTAAMEIYKWVAPDGSTHYGESLPDGEIASFEILEVTPATPRPSPAARDYQATLDMAARMQADRLERERIRLEQEKLSQQERRARDDAQRFNGNYAYPLYFAPYYHYPYRPYRRPPPYPGKYPVHPPSRPPPGPFRRPNVPKRVYVDR